MAENKYMLFTRGPAKVYLKSTPTEDYVLQIDDDIEIYLDESMERILMHCVFQMNRKGLFAEGVRWMGGIDYIPEVIDELWDKFVSDHQKLPVLSFKLEDLPLQGNQKGGLRLSIPGHWVTISAKDEIEIMGKLKAWPREKMMRLLRAWFSSFCYTYALDLRKCKGSKSEYLADAFLGQHGISEDSIPILFEYSEQYTKQLERAAGLERKWKPIEWLLTEKGFFPFLANFSIGMVLVWVHESTPDFMHASTFRIILGGVCLVAGALFVFFAFTKIWPRNDSTY